MKVKNSIFLFLFPAMLALIFDSQTALQGALDGTMLCLQTVIPSLFPFLFMTALLSASVRSVFHGNLGIWVLGAIGGYPAGAQAAAIACRQGDISRQDASRLLVLCNNTGPAFLFGIGATVFGGPIPCLLLWGIQIFSAWILSRILPVAHSDNTARPSSQPLSTSVAMAGAIRAMGQICGWVVLFRVILSYCQRCIFSHFPADPVIFLSGLLEMTNGCCQLSALPPDRAFILFAFLSGFGGLCVWMQTRAVTGDIPMSLYIPVKFTQGVLCALLAIVLRQCVFPEAGALSYPILPVLCLVEILLIVLICRNTKIKVAFPQKVLYNKQKIKL